MEANKYKLKSIRVSACSKVLATGAYLILDPKYEGIVLATDAFFETKIAPSINPKDH